MTRGHAYVRRGAILPSLEHTGEDEVRRQAMEAIDRYRHADGSYRPREPDCPCHRPRDINKLKRCLAPFQLQQGQVLPRKAASCCHSVASAGAGTGGPTTPGVRSPPKHLGAPLGDRLVENGRDGYLGAVCHGQIPMVDIHVECGEHERRRHRHGFRRSGVGHHLLQCARS